MSTLQPTSEGEAVVSNAVADVAVHTNENPDVTEYHERLKEWRVVEPLDPSRYDEFGFVIPDATDEKDAMVSRYFFVNDEVISPQERNVRENRWRSLIKHRNKWEDKYNEEVKLGTRNGLPSSMRGKIWTYLCDSDELKAKHPNLYSSLLQQRIQDRSIYNQILRDLDRTFPHHEMFRNPRDLGQAALFNVLRAYAIYNPTVGYTQGMNFVAAILLMYMPEDEAFYTFAMVMGSEFYLKGMYEGCLEEARLEAQAFHRLLKQESPKMAKHLERISEMPTPPVYFKWFLMMFTLSLPWPTVLRVWDCFLSEGRKMLYRTGLAILINLKDEILSTDEPDVLLPMLEKPVKYTKASELLQTAFSISLSRKDIEKARKKEKKAMAQQELEA